MKKTVAIIGAVVLGLGLVAGCSGSGSDAPKPAGPGTGAPAGTGSVGVGLVDLQQWVDDYAVASAGLTTAHFTMSVDMTDTSTDESLEAWEAEGDMDVTDPGNQKITMSLHEGALWVDVVYFDGKAYLKLGSTYIQQDSLPVGGWVGLLDQREAFKNQVTKVQMVGTEQVTGVETTHYLVTYETDKFEGLVPGSQGTDTVDVDLWMDEQTMIVKLSTIYTVGTVVLTMDVVFTDFGKVVSIEAPR
ncbi:MAG: LppX_LprAFG lipoprotein [Micrococcales bacterium]|nr:LppX_LprAFG lipoprotein [Micrococcales bacterium]MCL2667989.1 LppX_LprAFG lipoprotein [Micrococcales bacterium]